MTARGDRFALELSRRGVPVSDQVREVCGRLARCAVTVQRLAEEECNGPSWACSAWANSVRASEYERKMYRWQANLDKRMANAEKRFGRLVGELREAVALASPSGANEWLGGFSVWGDPRGNTTAVDVLRGDRTDTVGVIA